MAGKTFQHRHTVRFGETDCAGIVYYPNFFDIYQQTEEEFLLAENLPLHELLERPKRGFPIVHAEAGFSKPVRFGDVLVVDLTVVRLGTASVTYHFEARLDGGGLCGWADITHVLVDGEVFKSVPLPDDLRAALAKYVR